VGLSDGSSIITGLFNNTVTFGLGESNETSLTADGEYDVFIARYDINGSLVWAKREGGEQGPDMGFAVHAANDESFYVTGSFHGFATFGPGEENEVILDAAGPLDIFIAKHSASDGSLDWAKRAGGVGPDEGRAVFAYPPNSLFVTGRYSDSAVFAEGEVNETTITSDSSVEIFIAKYAM
jgi:hypothetical protein